ncbi:hypothetical protein D3C80_1413340 [compost metagenome]
MTQETSNGDLIGCIKSCRCRSSGLPAFDRKPQGRVTGIIHFAEGQAPDLSQRQAGCR